MYKIEFEGTDGAGKTTGLKYFINKARNLGYKAIETREVGNPNIPVCLQLRELALSPGSNLSGESMEFIFSAMRIENEKWLNNLKNSLNPPDFVVSDRGWFSHLAYAEHNVSRKFTEMLYDGVVSNITGLPDVVIYFNVDSETALKRRQKRGADNDAIEMKGIQFQELVRSSFEADLLKAEKYSNILVFRVNANENLESVRHQLDSILAELLPN